MKDEVTGSTYLYSCYLSLFGFGVTPSDAQRLFLALHLGITPGSSQGTIWDAEDQTQVSYEQGKCPAHPVMLYLDLSRVMTQTKELVC